MDELIQIPIYLFQIMYTVTSSAIPIIIIIFVIGLIGKFGKKAIRSYTD